MSHPASVTYWIFDRIHCTWVRVTTTWDVWHGLPHVVMALGCVAAAGGLPPIERGPAVPAAAAPEAPAEEAPQDISLPPGLVIAIPEYSPAIGRQSRAVPEPASLAVLAAGVVALMVLRRKRGSPRGLH